MRNETARREIESLDYYLQNHTDDYSEESHTAMLMAIDALNNADVLDKIKDEIAEYKDDKVIHAEQNEMIDIMLDIIDKYRG